MFARIENNTVMEYPIPNINQRFPNISFPLDPKDSDLPEGFVRVYAAENPTPGPLEKLVSLGPVQQDGRWVHGYEVAPLTQEELIERTAQKAAEVRAQRNERLAACDWTQVLDAPVSREAWADYRQALRDVTEQVGFPFDVVWPEPPAN